jgi:hypothetical protein
LFSADNVEDFIMVFVPHQYRVRRLIGSIDLSPNSPITRQNVKLTNLIYIKEKNITEDMAVRYIGKIYQKKEIHMFSNML